MYKKEMNKIARDEMNKIFLEEGIFSGFVGDNTGNSYETASAEPLHDSEVPNIPYDQKDINGYGTLLSVLPRIVSFIEKYKEDNKYNTILLSPIETNIYNNINNDSKAIDMIVPVHWRVSLANMLQLTNNSNLDYVIRDANIPPSDMSKPMKLIRISGIKPLNSPVSQLSTQYDTGETNYMKPTTGLVRGVVDTAVSAHRKHNPASA